jgi:hypothetical protein
MSEAFANRHHHCERVDGLNRGIWTSYGPAGTQEHPTGPPVEMYLRCNHDNCRRIDWRTVHGLQCHIVKNHEQPKGTIGSLEKALDRYGVPIKEVEDYEREHGEGTGGQMADPKNLKIKNKTRDALNRKSTPASYGIDPSARPAGYKPSPPGLRDSPTLSGGPRHSSGSMIRRAYGHEESYSDTDDSGSVQGEIRKSGPPPARFEVMKNDWNSRPPPTTSLGRSPLEANRQLQGDAVMKDAPPVSTATWKHWSPVNPTPEPTATSRTVSIPESSHTLSNESVPKSSVPESTAPTSSLQIGLPSTQTQAMAKEVLKIEEKQEKADSNFATPNPTETQNTDTQMSGVSETQVSATQDPSPAVDGAKDTPSAPEASTNAEEPPKPDAMEVDGEKEVSKLSESIPETTTKEVDTTSGGPASGTRASFASPVMTSRTINTPSSAKRMSRRSSTARKLSGDSNDGRNEVPEAPAKVDGEGVKEKEDGKDGDAGEKTDEDVITVETGRKEETREAMALREKEEREVRTPPRRNANGRFTRKRTLERGG